MLATSVGTFHEDSRRYLERGIAHLRGRATLPDQRLRRVPFVFKELLAFRYDAYSNSFFSAVRDLWV